MRSSPWAMAIRLLQAGGGMLAVILLWSTAGQRLDGWVAWVADAAFWTYLVLRPVGVPLTWLSSTFDVDDRGVRFRLGWLGRNETFADWAEIVSVDVSQPSLHRLFGCYTIRFGLGTTQKQAVRIDAVSGATRDAIVAIARRAQLGPQVPAEHDEVIPAAAVREADEIYRIRPSAYFLVPVTYGSFVLFVPAVFSVLDQVEEWVSLPVPDPAVLLDLPLPAQLAAGLAVLVLSVGYGWLFAWSRYRGLRVVRGPGGYVASGGLLSSETRTVTASQVTGLKITQNPLMRVLGHGRVTVLTNDAGDQPMANLLFPVVRLTTLPAALGPDMPVHPEVLTPTLRMNTPARTSIVAGLALAWCGLVTTAYLVQPDWIAFTATAVTVVVALLMNACWVVATTVPDRQVCYARRGLFWVSHVEFATTAIQVVQSGQGPLGRLTGTWSVVLHYYDGRIRRVRAIGCSPAQRTALTSPVLT